MLVTGVAVEKVGLSKKSQKSGDRKCPGDSEKSFIELPDAKQFLRNRSERVFQQPQGLSLPISFRDCWCEEDFSTPIGGSPALASIPSRYRSFAYSALAVMRREHLGRVLPENEKILVRLLRFLSEVTPTGSSVSGIANIRIRQKRLDVRQPVGHGEERHLLARDLLVIGSNKVDRLL